MDANNHSEKDMLNACFTGDKEAWDAFVEKYTNLIYHTIHKNNADFLYHEVEDIHNSIFLSLMENNHKKLKSFKGKNNCTLSSWLMVVTANFTKNFIKKEKKRYKSHIPIENSSNDNKNIIEELKKKYLMKNPGDEEFYEICFEKELPAEEIAKKLNIDKNAVYSKKSRIIGKLKKIAKKNKILQET
tara:strand:- start:44 stop:604 length:561 start_codon:yes stop_codon:yes gene_type:complete